MKVRARYLITSAAGIISAMFGAAHWMETTKAPTTPPPAVADVLYGDEVRVRLYRGLTGRFADHATDVFGLEAHKLCGVRFYVETQGGMDEAALRSPVIRGAKFVVFVGTSMGGRKARDMAEAFAPKKVRLLLVDTVPWTGPIPANVGADHVVWRGTVPFNLGRGRPEGTIDDPQHDRPINKTHGWLIHSEDVRKQVAEEICRGITHPSKRPAGK